jgi:hypothetical protein
MLVKAKSVSVDKVGIVYVVDENGRVWRKGEIDKQWEELVMPDIDQHGQFRVRSAQSK